jgi:hypothetical protein
MARRGCTQLALGVGALRPGCLARTRTRVTGAAICALVCGVLAGCGSGSSATTSNTHSKATNSPSVAPVDVMRELFTAGKSHDFTGYCAMLVPAARVAVRAARKDPLHDIGASCEQKLASESAESNLPLSRGYTSLRTASETGADALVEVKNEREGITGSERAYTTELLRCGNSWLWTGWASYDDSNPLAKNLFASLVRHYGCEPEAEVIKHRGLVIVNEESTPSATGTEDG